MEYRQQYFVKSNYTLLSFAFPWKKNKDEQLYINETKEYCKNILKKDIQDLWIWEKLNIYPVTNSDPENF